MYNFLTFLFIHNLLSIRIYKTSLSNGVRVYSQFNPRNRYPSGVKTIAISCTQAKPGSCTLRNRLRQRQIRQRALSPGSGSRHHHHTQRLRQFPQRRSCCVGHSCWFTALYASTEYPSRTAGLIHTPAVGVRGLS